LPDRFFSLFLCGERGLLKESDLVKTTICSEDFATAKSAWESYVKSVKGYEIKGAAEQIFPFCCPQLQELLLKNENNWETPLKRRDAIKVLLALSLNHNGKQLLSILESVYPKTKNPYPKDETLESELLSLIHLFIRDERLEETKGFLMLTAERGLIPKEELKIPWLDCCQKLPDLQDKKTFYYSGLNANVLADGEQHILLQEMALAFEETGDKDMAFHLADTVLKVDKQEKYTVLTIQERADLSRIWLKSFSFKLEKDWKLAAELVRVVAREALADPTLLWAAVTKLANTHFHMQALELLADPVFSSKSFTAFKQKKQNLVNTICERWEKTTKNVEDEIPKVLSALFSMAFDITLSDALEKVTSKMEAHAGAIAIAPSDLQEIIAGNLATWFSHTPNHVYRIISLLHLCKIKFAVNEKESETICEAAETDLSARQPSEQELRTFISALTAFVKKKDLPPSLSDLFIGNFNRLKRYADALPWITEYSSVEEGVNALTGSLITSPKTALTEIKKNPSMMRRLILYIDAQLILEIPSEDLLYIMMTFNLSHSMLWLKYFSICTRIEEEAWIVFFTHLQGKTFHANKETALKCWNKALTFLLESNVKFLCTVLENPKCLMSLYDNLDQEETKASFYIFCDIVCTTFPYRETEEKFRAYLSKIASGNNALEHLRILDIQLTITDLQNPTFSFFRKGCLNLAKMKGINIPDFFSRLPSSFEKRSEIIREPKLIKALCTIIETIRAAKCDFNTTNISGLCDFLGKQENPVLLEHYYQLLTDMEDPSSDQVLHHLSSLVCKLAAKKNPKLRQITWKFLNSSFSDKIPSDTLELIQTSYFTIYCKRATLVNQPANIQPILDEMDKLFDGEPFPWNCERPYFNARLAIIAVGIENFEQNFDWKKSLNQELMKIKERSQGSEKLYELKHVFHLFNFCDILISQSLKNLELCKSLLNYIYDILIDNDDTMQWANKDNLSLIADTFFSPLACHDEIYEAHLKKVLTILGSFKSKSQYRNLSYLFTLWAEKKPPVECFVKEESTPYTSEECDDIGGELLKPLFFNLQFPPVLARLQEIINAGSLSEAALMKGWLRIINSMTEDIKNVQATHFELFFSLIKQKKSYNDQTTLYHMFQEYLDCLRNAFAQASRLHEKIMLARLIINQFFGDCLFAYVPFSQGIALLPNTLNQFITIGKNSDIIEDVLSLLTNLETKVSLSTSDKSKLHEICLDFLRKANSVQNYLIQTNPIFLPERIADQKLAASILNLQKSDRNTRISILFSLKHYLEAHFKKDRRIYNDEEIDIIIASLQTKVSLEALTAIGPVIVELLTFPFLDFRFQQILCMGIKAYISHESPELQTLGEGLLFHPNFECLVASENADALWKNLLKNSQNNKKPLEKQDVRKVSSFFKRILSIESTSRRLTQTDISCLENFSFKNRALQNILNKNFLCAAEIPEQFQQPSLYACLMNHLRTSFFYPSFSSQWHSLFSTLLEKKILSPEAAATVIETLIIEMSEKRRATKKEADVEVYIHFIKSFIQLYHGIIHNSLLLNRYFDEVIQVLIQICKLEPSPEEGLSDTIFGNYFLRINKCLFSPIAQGNRSQHLRHPSTNELLYPDSDKEENDYPSEQSFQLMDRLCESLLKIGAEAASPEHNLLIIKFVGLWYAHLNKEYMWKAEGCKAGICLLIKCNFNLSSKGRETYIAILDSLIDDMCYILPHSERIELISKTFDVMCRYENKNNESSQVNLQKLVEWMNLFIDEANNGRFPFDQLIQKLVAIFNYPPGTNETVTKHIERCQRFLRKCDFSKNLEAAAKYREEILELLFLTQMDLKEICKGLLLCYPPLANDPWQGNEHEVAFRVITQYAGPHDFLEAPDKITRTSVANYPMPRAVIRSKLARSILASLQIHVATKYPKEIAACYWAFLRALAKGFFFQTGRKDLKEVPAHICLKNDILHWYTTATTKKNFNQTHHSIISFVIIEYLNTLIQLCSLTDTLKEQLSTEHLPHNVLFINLEEFLKLGLLEKDQLTSHLLAAFPKIYAHIEDNVVHTFIKRHYKDITEREIILQAWKHSRL